MSPEYTAAVTEPVDAGPLSGLTMLSAVCLAVLEAARAIGLDADALAREAGLDPAALADPDGRVAVEHDLQLWAALARGHHGLALGAELGLHGLGVLGYAMQHGATVEAAYRWLERYDAVVHPGLVPTLEVRSEPAGRRAVFSRFVPPPFARLKEPVYAQAAAVVAGMSLVSGEATRAAFVAYPLPRPEDPERHERFFACPVAWGAAKLEVAFDAAVLARPLPRRDPRLFSYLARRAEALLAQLPAEGSAATRVRRAIAGELAEGEPRLAVIARRLAVSERTLSRRLQDEGTSFAALVEEARRERAELLLEDPRLSASEVAFLLGYSEPAAFFRAFKRWTGETPEAHRARRRGGSPSAPK